MFSKETINGIKKGKIAVLPTDTIYGLVCSASNKNSIEEMYRIKNRNVSKPFVFLIGNISQLKDLGIQTKEIFSKHWPGPTSLILSDTNIPEYLHRGKKSLAVRLPADKKLQELLNQTGPLASTSANLEGKTPATTIDEARAYLGTKVNLYIDRGKLLNKPSKIIRITGNTIKTVRE